MPKPKRCIVLNAPTTPQEQADYDKRFAKALATSLHRSLSPEEYDLLVKQLKQSIGRKKAVSG